MIRIKVRFLKKLLLIGYFVLIGFGGYFVLQKLMLYKSNTGYVFFPDKTEILPSNNVLPFKYNTGDSIYLWTRADIDLSLYIDPEKMFWDSLKNIPINSYFEISPEKLVSSKNKKNIAPILRRVV